MILVLNQSPNSTVFSIVRVPGGAKTVLSGDPLYHVIYQILIRYLQNPLEKYRRFETPFLTTQIKEDGQLSFLSGQILGIKVPQI